MFCKNSYEISLRGSLSLINFLAASCTSLQFSWIDRNETEAPSNISSLFFPTFELTLWLVSPLLGGLLDILDGCERAVIWSALSLGVSTLLLSSLQILESVFYCTLLNLLFRVGYGIGMSLLFTASLSLSAKTVVSNNKATSFAVIETSFVLGLLFGPILNVILVRLDSGISSFLIFGSTLLVVSLLLKANFVSSIYNPRVKPPYKDLIKILQIPGLYFCSLSILFSAYSLAFLLFSLEICLKDFNLWNSPDLSHLLIGLIGLFYGLLSILWGLLIDYTRTPISISCLGTLFVLGSFICLTSRLFVPIGIEWTFAFLILYGIGISAILLASYINMSKDALCHGFFFSESLVCALWISAFGSGAFFGALSRDRIFRNWGLQFGSYVFVGVSLLICLLTNFFYYFYRRTRKILEVSGFTSEEIDPILTKDKGKEQL